MRVTSKGQVTIPLAVRRQLGIGPGSEVEFELDERGARLVRAKTARGRRSHAECAAAPTYADLRATSMSVWPNGAARGRDPSASSGWSARWRRGGMRLQVYVTA
jgi:AbrB family looped-hinge helix DNA binding protein